MTTQPQYLSVKHAQAFKTGTHSSGRLSYRILRDPDSQQLALTLTGNDSSGWYSPEIVPLSNIETVLAQRIDPDQPIASRTLCRAFVSRSVNNGGFLCAVLRAEGLLKPAPEHLNQHLVTDDWEQWKAAMLSEPGETYVPPPPKGTAKTGAVELAADMQAQALPMPITKGKRKGAKKNDAPLSEPVDGVALEHDDANIEAS